MTWGRGACVFAATLLLLVGYLTVRDIADGPEPAPAPGPSVPAGIELVRVPRGGQEYDCMVYYRGGVWCWPDPTPTPDHE